MRSIPIALCPTIRPKSLILEALLRAHPVRGAKTICSEYMQRLPATNTGQTQLFRISVFDLLSRKRTPRAKRRGAGQREEKRWCAQRLIQRLRANVSYNLLENAFSKLAFNFNYRFLRRFSGYSKTWATSAAYTVSCSFVPDPCIHISLSYLNPWTPCFP